MLAKTDEQGYLVPAVDLELDELYELGFDIPDYGDPADWPEWTDHFCWFDGPAIPPDAAVEPFEPSEADLLDYAEWSAELGRGFLVEYPPSHLTDEDIVAVQGGA